MPTARFQLIFQGIICFFSLKSFIFCLNPLWNFATKKKTTGKMIGMSGTHLRMPCATGPLVEFSDGARLIIHSTQHPELGRSRCQSVYVLSVYVFFCEFPFFELILLISFATLISVLGFFFELPWFWFLSVCVGFFVLPSGHHTVKI